jgi:hypothetical protein
LKQQNHFQSICVVWHQTNPSGTPLFSCSFQNFYLTVNVSNRILYMGHIYYVSLPCRHTNSFFLPISFSSSFPVYSHEFRYLFCSPISYPIFSITFWSTIVRQYSISPQVRFCNKSIKRKQTDLSKLFKLKIQTKIFDNYQFKTKVRCLSAIKN